MANVSFLGLGVMGYPMAGHLAKAGHNVTVYNRTLDKAKKWISEYQGILASTPAIATKDAQYVFACVGNDSDLRMITTGRDGAFQTMQPHTIFVDHTTTSATVCRDLAKLAQERELHFLDAPVSGGQAGAEKGALTVMVGGDKAQYDKAEPIIKSYSKATQYMGATGSGQLTKMVNQICIAGTIQGLAEGLHFAKTLGLEPAKVLAAISQGAAGSWQMDNRGQTMADGKFDFGFAVDWMRKDLEICLEESSRHGIPLPITSLINQFYEELHNIGHGRLDTSSLILRLHSTRKTS